MLDTAIENYTMMGVLRDEARDYKSCTYEHRAGIHFNGMFMLHLGYFVDLLSKLSSQDTKLFDFVKNTSNSGPLLLMPP